ncbi:hypothetical protein CONPUDRAFT_50649 [Coniophora puteana RWD-64-598 SS2]|uniref:Uncharacterized protein n=1 Tax=Coniophora puteana (strain RWD-64-598) TaxID=741705 RepID=A0A5M3MYD1_CONPW|nr:uncharacterized protein CONPUDRAFT_50649 [Coniophora puteana RWD-64-598 SS2]EIW84056.1 hypothetical protein CONPUDRAFT_50649 [Coniophora puteana RWD-64-598 SS2]
MKSAPWKNGLALLAPALASVSSALLQAPFASPGQGLPVGDQSSWFTDADKWRFDERPSPNATSNYIFDTLASALQHWPNTRYRNGHAVIPAYVPTGTLLYHGSFTGAVPTTPEWTTPDPEHAYMFCRGGSDVGCWQLTLAAARPLRVLYFDGSSAAKMEFGSMHTQDIVAWRKLHPERMMDEYGRINDLCKWGEQYGLDGFVRMEPDFEVMLCNFTSGVEVVSWLNLFPAATTPIPPPPQPDDLQAPSQLDPPTAKSMLSPLYSLAFESTQAGSWRNRYPGDLRFILHTHRLLTFYDTSLAPSLVPARAGLDRWDHALFNLSDADITAFTQRLDEELRASQHEYEERGTDVAPSGVQWQTLARTLIDRHAERLELARGLLERGADAHAYGNVLRQARRAHVQLRTMIMPYVLYTAVPPAASDSSSGSPAPPHAWAAPIFRECATAHTAALFRPTMHARLTRSEQTLLRAVRETSREICRVVVGVWADGVELGIGERQVRDPIMNFPNPPDPEQDVPPPDVRMSESELRDMVGRWHAEINGLMAWLDWSEWVRCEPACGFEELCYLPTWPWDMIRIPGAPHKPMPKDEEGRPQWMRPQPRCIRRVEPYDLLE